VLCSFEVSVDLSPETFSAARTSPQLLGVKQHPKFTRTSAPPSLINMSPAKEVKKSIPKHSMKVSKAKRLKALEDENARLKKPLAE